MHLTARDLELVRQIVQRVWSGQGLRADDQTELVSRVLLALAEREESIRELRPYAYVVARRLLRDIKRERAREAETLAVVRWSLLGGDLPADVPVPTGDRPQWGGKRPGSGRPRRRGNQDHRS